MSWKNKFKVVGIKPQTIVWQGIKVNLRSSRTSLGRINKAYELGCPYLVPIAEEEKVKPTHISQVVVPDNEPQKTAQERVIENALAKGIITFKSGFIYFKGKRYGSKKIFSLPDVLLEIENEFTVAEESS